MAPSVYDLFAASVEWQHSLFLTSQCATHLLQGAYDDISIPLDAVSFARALRPAYGPLGEAPKNWRAAGPLIGLSGDLLQVALLLPAIGCAQIDGRKSRSAACLRLIDAPLAAAGAPYVRHGGPYPGPALRDLGDAEFVVFRGGLAQKDQVAIVVGKPDLTAPAPRRIHSHFITGELSGSQMRLR